MTRLIREGGTAHSQKRCASFARIAYFGELSVKEYMPSVENIRNSLIDKILSIKNKRFLMALDKLISSSQQSEPIALTEEQKEMLQMSQIDIESGQVVTQHELDELDREWLNSQ